MEDEEKRRAREKADRHENPSIRPGMPDADDGLTEKERQARNEDWAAAHRLGA